MPIVQASESTAIDPRWIALRASRIHLIVNVAGVLLALVILALVPLSNWLRLGVGSVFCAGFLWDLQLILLKSRRSVNAFYLFDLDVASDTGNVLPQPVKLGIRVGYVHTPDSVPANEAEGVILNGAFVSPWFTAVRYALPQDRIWRKWWPHVIPVWPDGIDAEEFRRLRVALKWK